MKRGQIETARTDSSAAPLRLRLQLTVPPGAVSTTTGILEPLVDGVVSALHAHDGSEVTDLAARLALLGPDAREISGLLLDTSRSILGTRRLLWRWREGVQWNPADDRVVTCELLVEHGDGRLLTGDLHTATTTGGAHPRAPLGAP